MLTRCETVVEPFFLLPASVFQMKQQVKRFFSFAWKIKTYDLFQVKQLPGTEILKSLYPGCFVSPLTPRGTGETVGGFPFKGSSQPSIAQPPSQLASGCSCQAFHSGWSLP
jgi:hypothetical protein